MNLINSINLTQFAYQTSRIFGKLGYSKLSIYYKVVENYLPSYDVSLDILNKHNLFLILSTGRTGSTWLSKLLNNPDRGVLVKHEPVPEEEHYHKIGISYPDKAQGYIQKLRLREMALRCMNTKPVIYGEVNTNLGPFAKIIKNLIPETKVLHIVRDGKEYVRSVMNRTSYSEKDSNQHDILPVGFERKVWDNYSRFQKICILWSYENKLLRQHSDKSIKYENLFDSYDRFKDLILSPLNLDIDLSEKWKNMNNKIVNPSSEYIFPKYENWTQNQKEIFHSMCETEMRQYSYSI
ncbi:MAG: hypothetical protein GF372_10820 [Candidatus Marinimicrobia bacterium]|nr:hypothetical protein [Candidatus Neomarinimicrobiota bacterium]